MKLGKSVYLWVKVHIYLQMVQHRGSKPIIWSRKYGFCWQRFTHQWICCSFWAVDDKLPIQHDRIFWRRILNAQKTHNKASFPHNKSVDRTLLSRPLPMPHPFFVRFMAGCTAVAAPPQPPKHYSNIKTRHRSFDVFDFMSFTVFNSLYDQSLQWIIINQVILRYPTLLQPQLSWYDDQIIRWTPL